MMQDEFTRLFFEYAKKMMAQSKMHIDTSITPDNIFQEAHKANRDTLFEIIKMAHLPNSTMLGTENLIKLYEISQTGKSCLILSEHLSNLDVPSMFVRFYEYPDSLMKKIFEKIIFIAGVKLNETPLVKLYTEMFSRIVIFPIRSLSRMEDSEANREKIALAKKINIRATRKLGELRNKGYLFVMFPAGTRYRPWRPETKRGIKEATSYLNSFDYFLCSSINGNNMLPKEHEDMTREQYKKDIIVFNYGEVRETKEYIRKITEDQSSFSSENKDQMKQFIVDRIMDEIDILHNKSDEYIFGLKP